jgi:hypothetical protein
MEQRISNKGRSKVSRDRVSDSPSSIENRRETGIGAVPGGAVHRWRPGQSGNPSGRPRMGALAHACRTVLEQLVPGDQQGRTYAQAIAERLAELALKGHSSSIRELADRAEGRAGQLLNVEIRPARLEPEGQEMDPSSGDALLVQTALVSKDA